MGGQGVKIGRPAPLADQVYGALAGDVLEGRLVAGARLPTEAELAVRFGVSRTVIREAMARLRNDGLVQSRQGAGVFVAERGADRTFRFGGEAVVNAGHIREIFELRLGIEVEAAALAARRRTPTDVQVMSRALLEMKATAEGPDLGVAADAAFHRALALASGNSKIAAFQKYLAGFLEEGIFAAREHTRRTHPGMAGEVMDEHVAILQAVKAEDGEAARGAMRAHLVNAQGRLGLLEGEARRGYLR